MRTRAVQTRRALARVAFALCAVCAAGLIPAYAEGDNDAWAGIRKDVYGARQIDETTAFTIDAPYRAEDAAVVPVTIKIPDAIAGSVAKLTIIVDKNPVPVAAVFTFGAAAGGGERMISTRMRFDMYSTLRAVIETTDGKLLMVSRFVKAAGGCSAPALKDADQATANIGKMQVKLFGNDTTQSGARQAQVMIRHPNYSGMQMNQLTGLYIPAKFVNQIEVKRGTELVFSVESGISLSEDPNIRFTYAHGAGAGDTIDVTATDTDGKVYTGRGEPKNS